MRHWLKLGNRKKPLVGDKPRARAPVALITIHYSLSSARAVSSAVEHLVYTERVGGSNPSPPSLRSQRNGERGLSRRSFSEGGPFLPCNVNAASFDSACHSKMKTFTYVYVLQSETDSRRFYTGCTLDLRKRLARHNNGEVPHTSKWKPWRIKTYIAFSDRVQAKAFERYLKSASGRAFLKKRL